jgi:hypothetical protein
VVEPPPEPPQGRRARHPRREEERCGRLLNGGASRSTGRGRSRRPCGSNSWPARM